MSAALIRLRCLLRTSRMTQVALLLVFWLAGEAVAAALDLPIPGGVIGMGLVLALLLSRRLSPVTVRRGGNWLLADMLLFFVPATLAVLDHRELLGLLGLKLLAVILLGTLAVMAVTAVTVDLCLRGAARRGD